MIAIRHTGIYVADIVLLENFYRTVFEMIPICSMERDSGRLFDELLGMKVELMTSKLVTPYGKKQGQGDMIELVKVLTDTGVSDFPKDHPIYTIGNAHIAFGVDDIKAVVRAIIDNGGQQKTDIQIMKNGNSCCFCTDPEGNWIELIQRK